MIRDREQWCEGSSVYVNGGPHVYVYVPVCLSDLRFVDANRSIVRRLEPKRNKVHW